MTRTVAVVDYGMGNLRSVSQALMHVAAGTDCRVIVTASPDDVLAAERVVLPGQGAMRDCMAELQRSGLKPAVLDAARRKPLFGECVGMQILLEHSEEQDWQRHHGGASHALWAGVPDGAFNYFVHSYYAQPSDECHTAGDTDYGGRFTCAIARDNIFATQFHPEKSAQHGLTLYRNFLSWMP